MSCNICITLRIRCNQVFPDRLILWRFQLVYGLRARTTNKFHPGTTISRNTFSRMSMIRTNQFKMDDTISRDTLHLGTSEFNSLRLSAETAPSYYLNQCWNIANTKLMNKLQWGLKRNSYIFIQENAFENVVCEMQNFVSAAMLWSIIGGLFTLYNNYCIQPTVNSLAPGKCGN